MEKLRLDVEGVMVESFEPLSGGDNGRGMSCSMQPTCGVASRGEEAYEQIKKTLYACCV